MRIDPARSAAVPDRLRAAIDAARKQLGALGVRGRLAWAAALLAALVAVGYQLSAVESVGYDWLYEGPLPRDEAARLVAALRRVNIPCEIDPRGKISVPTHRRAEALAALAKEKLGPRAIDELIDEAINTGSFWDDPARRRDQELRARGKVLAGIIGRIAGVLHATVVLAPSEPAAPGAGPASALVLPRPSASRLKATVLVQSEADGLLPERTIGMIENVLTGQNFRREDLTILDLSSRHPYRVAGEPDVGVQSSARAREEELQAELQNLLAIEGARIAVHVELPPAPAESGPPLSVNAPIDLAPAPPEAESGPAGAGKVSVFVRVPRSYYQRAYSERHRGREPSVEELRLYAIGTGESIRRTVAAVLRPGEPHEVKVEPFDDLGSARAPAPSGESDARRVLAVWLPPIAGAGAVVGLIALGVGLLAARRPASRSRRAVTAGRREAFEAGDLAGPGERVRTLIRNDPAAAAGVLHRWISEGGRPA